MNLKICFVTSEVVPYSKTGGLADVSGALPRALARLGHDVRVLTPRYGTVDQERYELQPLADGRELAVRVRDHDFAVHFFANAGAENAPSVYFLEHGPLFDRPGIYVDPFTNRDYIDNDYRYILLSKTAVRMDEIVGWTPDILHCHDWQSALAAYYLRSRQAEGVMPETRSVLTVHNMSYQGLFPPEAIHRVGDGAERFFHGGGPLEFYGKVNFLKAGIEFADAVNTVSPTYAKEIQSSYEFGYGLETVLRQRGDVTGIVNGIDVSIWNPAADAKIAKTYSAESLERKEANKEALALAMGLPYAPELPLFAIISRVVPQKGFDLLVEALPDILNTPVQFVALGSGDPHYEHILQEIARVYPERAAVKIGYDEDLSHLIEAGADAFLMPSRYEPCGLNQMMSMRYGTVPVVRETGGLADTVTDVDRDPEDGTGFCFSAYDAAEFLSAVRRAVAAYRDRERWRKIQRNGMRRDFSWRHAAEQYVAMYERCLAKPARAVA